MLGAVFSELGAVFRSLKVGLSESEAPLAISCKYYKEISGHLERAGDILLRRESRRYSAEKSATILRYIEYIRVRSI